MSYCHFAWMAAKAREWLLREIFSGTAKALLCFTAGERLQTRGHRMLLWIQLSPMTQVRCILRTVNSELPATQSALTRCKKIPGQDMRWLLVRQGRDLCLGSTTEHIHGRKQAWNWSDLKWAIDCHKSASTLGWILQDPIQRKSPWRQIKWTCSNQLWIQGLMVFLLHYEDPCPTKNTCNIGNEELDSGKYKRPTWNNESSDRIDYSEDRRI